MKAWMTLGLAAVMSLACTAAMADGMPLKACQEYTSDRAQLIDAKNWAKLVEASNSFLRICPTKSRLDNAVALSGAALGYLESSNISAAQKAIDVCVSEFYYLVECHFLRAEGLVRQGFWKQALEVVETESWICSEEGRRNEAEWSNLTGAKGSGARTWADERKRQLVMEMGSNSFYCSRIKAQRSQIDLAMKATLERRKEEERREAVALKCKDRSAELFDPACGSSVSRRNH